MVLALGPLEIHLRHLRQLCCESSAVACRNSQEAVGARKCTRAFPGTANKTGLIHSVCRRVCSLGHRCITLRQGTLSSSVCRCSAVGWKTVTEIGKHTTCNAPTKLHNPFCQIHNRAFHTRVNNGLPEHRIPVYSGMIAVTYPYHTTTFLDVSWSLSRSILRSSDSTWRGERA